MSEKIVENHFQVTGMTCAACANRIEKGLNKMEGVQEANVNLALEKATVKFDASAVSSTDIGQKVRNLGYDVVTEKKELVLTGMTCAACATRIEKGLNKMDGVMNATVNLALEKATVEYNPADVSLNDMIHKVENLGYGAIIKSDENEQEAVDYRQKEIEKQQGKFLFSMILSLPLLWAMVGHFSFTSFLYVPDVFMNPWVQMALATPIQFYIGKQF
jgi:P-type Cu+ transporter